VHPRFFAGRRGWERSTAVATLQVIEIETTQIGRTMNEIHNVDMSTSAQTTGIAQPSSAPARASNRSIVTAVAERQ
jgi:hypothetical protein